MLGKRKLALHDSPALPPVPAPKKKKVQPTKTFAPLKHSDLSEAELEKIVTIKNDVDFYLYKEQFT